VLHRKFVAYQQALIVFDAAPWQEDITPHMFEFEQQHLLIISALDTLQLGLMVATASAVPPTLTVLLLYVNIPFHLIGSSFLFPDRWDRRLSVRALHDCSGLMHHRSYTKRRIIGVSLITLAMLICVADALIRMLLRDEYHEGEPQVYMHQATEVLDTT
jgi:hypothetical protein